MRSGELTRIVDAVAEFDGAVPNDLPPLHDAIDTEALSRLFAPTDRSNRNWGHVSFQYNGYTIAYYADGHIEIDSSTEPGSD